MARPRSVRCWTAILWTLCLVAAGAWAASASDRPVGEPPPTAVAGRSGAAHAALLPARVTDDVRVVAKQAGTLRLLLVPAVLAALVGVAAARHGRAGTVPGRHRRLPRSRSAIALRAPPLLLA